MPVDDTIQQPFYLWEEAYPMPDTMQNTGIPIDSIFRLADSMPECLRETLFKGHMLTPQHTEMLQRTATHQPLWLFILLIALCALLFLYYNNHKIKITELLKSAVDRRTAERLVRECGFTHSMAIVPIAFLLSAVAAVLIWSVAMAKTEMGGYLLTTLAIATAYLLRNGILHWLASIFDQEQTVSAYIISNYTLHLILTTAVLPLLFAAIYIPSATNVAVYVAGILTALVFLIRMINGINILFKKTNSFHFFLFYYLCIVEIAPILVALKWFIAQ